MVYSKWVMVWIGMLMMGMTSAYAQNMLAPGRSQRQAIDAIIRRCFVQTTPAPTLFLRSDLLCDPAFEQESISLYDAIPEKVAAWRMMNKAHAKYVAVLAAYMAEKLQLGPDIVRFVYRVGLLHDSAKKNPDFYFQEHPFLVNLIDRTGIPMHPIKFYPFLEKALKHPFTPSVFLNAHLYFFDFFEKSLIEQRDERLIYDLLTANVITKERKMTSVFRTCISIFINHGIESYRFVSASPFKSLFTDKELQRAYFMFAFHHAPRLVQAGTMEHLLTQILMAADIIQANNDGIRIEQYKKTGMSTGFSFREEVKGGTFNIMKINLDNGNFDPLFYLFVKSLLCDEAFLRLIEEIRSTGRSEQERITADDREYSIEIKQAYQLFAAAV